MQDGPEPSPLKLAYVVDSLVTGGAERLVVTFARATRNRPDIDLTVFVLSGGGTPFSDELERMDIEVVYLPGKTLLDVGRFLKLVSELRKRSIEYVHAHLTSSTVLGGWAAAFLRLPFATTIHNVKTSTARVSKIRGALYRSVLRMPGTVRIAVGQAVAKAARVDTGGRDCIVVPNAVSSDAVAPPGARAAVRAQLGMKDCKVLIAVGTIIGQKAYDDLLAAYAQVSVRVPDTVLLVVGNAPDANRYENLQKLAADLGIAEQVRFLGQRQDVPDLLSAADLFVSASHWEGLPVSVLEAMANGVPCVVTDVGDNALILDSTGAPVVPPEQPNMLARSLLDLLQDDIARKQVGQAARTRVAEHYGVNAWVEKLTKIYSNQKYQKRRFSFGLRNSTSAASFAADHRDETS
ncbi:glycosyltransferase [Ruegeria atlantica]|uniref:GDP-mannose-dependent alpha-(1-6)-phosphatidylinositol monomannoside mannosyltransferase n=1 Tax=Ruegeria atlantica TaxID=81569 RepID=A0A0P1EP06_9RHOB|nr:glycosyltransferase [Ruegeria atlantica]CUH42202.1 GDP-mannose-dependent alpha-(1-6)-phosphatidylinositol monomannoside mannosyltransferase [Ruegeria atlantica]